MVEYGYVKDHTWATNPEPVPGMLLRVLRDQRGKRLCGQIEKARKDLSIYGVAITDGPASAEGPAYRTIFFPQGLFGIKPFFQLMERLYMTDAVNYRPGELLEYVDELVRDGMLDQQKAVEIKLSMPVHRAAAVPVVDELDAAYAVALTTHLPQTVWATEHKAPAVMADKVVSPTRRVGL